MEIFAPTARGLEASEVGAAAAGAVAGRGAGLVDITIYSTPSSPHGVEIFARFECPPIGGF